jgi:hypothetical protein
MAYTAFENGVPVSSDTGLVVVTDIRNNLAALRDALALGGMVGWNYSKTDGTGTAEEPQYVYYANSTLKIRGTLTWTSGNVTVAVWAFSTDSGGTYPDTIGTETIAYDGSGNVVTVTWS